MSQTVEKLIIKLKEFDFEEKQIKGLKSELLAKLKELDQQLDLISTKRSLALKELELVNSSDQSENDFQSLCSDNSIYPKSSDLDIDSDEWTQKRKERSDSTNSDVETKKVKSVSNRMTCVEDVNNFDQQMVNKCIDEMANRVIKEISGSDIRLKDELEKLSEDPLFESLVKDVEQKNRRDMLTQTTPTLTSLFRSYSTDGNFKENVVPNGRVRRTASNRFKFDQQSTRLSPNKSKSNVNSQQTIIPSKLLKGKKLLSSLLSDKQTIDEKREKSFTEKVEITSKDFKENMFFWEKKTNESLLQNKQSQKIISI